MSSEDLLNRKGEIKQDFHVTTDYLDKGGSEAERVADELTHTRATLDDLDEQFCKTTGLTKTDAIFLFVAIGLQIARQYVFSNDKFRVSDKQGDKMMEKVLDLSPAPKSWQDVLLQSVPYDAFDTSIHVSNTGLGGSTHRYRTLGHDPLLGWIFGTANIMTNSLTKTDLETYQVNMQTFTLVRHYPLGVAGMLENAVEYGHNDSKLFAAAVARQAIHFGSDFFTKQGLPVPVIATVNNDLAKDMLTKWNIDAYSITRGASLSVFINTLISLIHGLFFRGGSDMDRKLYEVRTRKILSYSNLVATFSNIAVVAVTKDLKKLDVGGMAVTIYRLVTDAKFIKQVKEEFIFGGYHEIIEGDKEYLYLE
jgi:hypothetical protein